VTTSETPTTGVTRNGLARTTCVTQAVAAMSTVTARGPLASSAPSAPRGWRNSKGRDRRRALTALALDDRAAVEPRRAGDTRPSCALIGAGCPFWDSEFGCRLRRAGAPSAVRSVGRLWTPSTAQKRVRPPFACRRRGKSFDDYYGSHLGKRHTFT
jgi:hypothetical protein